MGFIIFLVFVWIVVSAIRSAARKQQAQVVLPPDFFGTHDLPPGHVRHVVSAPAAALGRVPTEESSSELLVDETAAGHDLDLGHAEVVSLEMVPPMSVAARPLPDAAASLETEVDWEAEHERFHRRYVDVRQAAPSPARGLMDELRDPAGARRAVLMAEILGPPVSMRR
ncbi:MAG TPA: hypothetical protein VF142_05580 [Longimicrobium sp.]